MCCCFVYVVACTQDWRKLASGKRKHLLTPNPNPTTLHPKRSQKPELPGPHPHHSAPHMSQLEIIRSRDAQTLEFWLRLAEFSHVIRGMSSTLQACFSKGARRLLRLLLEGEPCDGTDGALLSSARIQTRSLQHKGGCSVNKKYCLDISAFHFPKLSCRCTSSPKPLPFHGDPVA